MVDPMDKIEGPYLFLDCYPYDYDDPRTKQIENPPWSTLLSAEPLLRGVIMKATDGESYSFTEWFVSNFRTLAARADRGWTFLIGGYHYLQIFRDPKKQADFYLSVLDKAGWRPEFDIVPIVDVEHGGERAANHRATAEQTVACTTAFSERVLEQTGIAPMLYGRGMMRELSIGSKMGCSRVWNPAYTEKMVTNGLTGKLPNGKPGPWSLDDIVLWQYGGDGVGDADVHHLPLRVAGKGIDLSVAVDGPRKVSWPNTRRRMTR